MASNSDSVSLKKCGRAYRCRNCEYLGSFSDTRWHFMKNHIPLHKVQYHCSLCQYWAKDRKMLNDHVKTWRPHAKQAKVRKLDPESTECLVEAKESYEMICCEDEDKIGDITILSLKDSCEEWSNRQRSSERNSMETPKNKSKSKKDRDLEYAMKILREQGVEFTVGKSRVNKTAVKETKTEEKDWDEQEPVITVDCVRLTDTDDRCSRSSSNSESETSEQSEDEDKTAVGNLIKVMENEQINPTGE